jgi:hypothetical protein
MNRKFDPDNRFDRAYLEYVQESRGFVKRDDRFECLRDAPTKTYENRFECLRDAPPKTYENRFECLRDTPTKTSENRFECLRDAPPKTYENRFEVMRDSHIEHFQKETTPTPTRPPGLPSPRKKSVMEEFPSLPSSPSTPKTPKCIVEPLREEIEFIPLPKPEPTCMSVSFKNGYVMTPTYGLDGKEPEQMYRVVRKISGGSWSDRVKYSCSEPMNEQINYDEDGFPMIQSIEDMVNNFS